MFLDIAILAVSTLAFVLWVVVIILYAKENKELRERNETLRMKVELDRYKRTITISVREAIQFLEESNIKPVCNGMYSHLQLQQALFQQALKNKTKKPDGGNE